MVSETANAFHGEVMKKLLRLSIKCSLMLAILVTVDSRTALAEEMVTQIQAILISGEARTEAVDKTQVEIRRAVDGRTEPGQAGMRLVVGDEVKTGDGAEVSLVVTRPGTYDRIEIFVLENSRASMSSLFAFYGSFVVSGLGIFDTKARYVRLGKRGTEFQVNVDTDGADLTVLRGEVDVEKGEFAPVPSGAVPTDDFINARYERPRPERAQRKVISGLHSVRIEKDKPIPEPRLMEPTEVLSFVAKTNHLYIATMPARLPTNIRPTTYALGDDPAENKRRATEAFIKARREAILNPDAKTTQRLGEVYKDFGAGERSTEEFNKAVKLNPALMNDINFLISSSEAYRLSGNLEDSQKRLKAAFTYVPTADARTRGVARIASGNLAYDKAIVSIVRDDGPAAAKYFMESKKAFEAAGDSPIGDTDPVIFYNLNNVKLALNKKDPTATAPTGLDGTYRGKMNFPAAALTGDATLVITGNRFSLTHCKRSLDGTIVARTTPEGQVYDLIFETQAPIAKLAVRFTGPEKARVITNAPGENHLFNFTQNQTTTAMTCVQINKIARERVLQ
jgi:hypothetical protein